MKSILIFILTFVLCFSCKTTNKEGASYKITDNKEIQMKDDYQSIYNKSKTLILYYKVEEHRSDPAKHFNFFIKRVNDGKKIYENQFRGENIEWNNDDSIKLTHYVGMIKKEDNSSLLEKNDPKTLNNNNFKIIKLNINK